MLAAKDATEANGPSTQASSIFSAVGLTTLGLSRQVPWRHCTARTELKLAVCDAAATLELAEKALRLPSNLGP